MVYYNIQFVWNFGFQVSDMWQISRISYQPFVWTLQMYVSLLRSLFSLRSLLLILPKTHSKLKRTDKSRKTSKISYLPKLNLPTTHIIDCLKVIAHDLVRSLKLSCLGISWMEFMVSWMDLLEELDQWITDLLLHTNKH